MVWWRSWWRTTGWGGSSCGNEFGMVWQTGRKTHKQRNIENILQKLFRKRFKCWFVGWMYRPGKGGKVESLDRLLNGRKRNRGVFSRYRRMYLHTRRLFGDLFWFAEFWGLQKFSRVYRFFLTKSKFWIFMKTYFWASKWPSLKIPEFNPKRKS